MIDRVKELLLMTDLQCQVYLTRVLNEYGYHVIVGREKDSTDADFIFAYPPDKQIMPVLLMAHWDTVRTKNGKISDEPVTLFEEFGKIENASGILGADDRAGIGAILETIETFNEKPLVLFTNFEESGGVGMKKFLSTDLFDEWIKCVYLAISCDRHGHNQWVCYYNNGNEELESLMSRVGYVEEVGTWTDGSRLALQYNLAHVNVSCGGYLQHKADEFLLVDSYISSVERLCNLVERIDHKIERVEIAYSYRGYGTSYYDAKYSVITPSSNAGKGTAAFDKVPAGTRVMVHQPVNAPLTMRLPAPVCEVCGRDEYGVSFNTKARKFLCFKCVNRIYDKYKEISPLTCHLGVQDLHNERKRTREANILLSKKTKEHTDKYPSCPRCHKNTHVSWYTREAGFLCTECSYAHSIHPETDAWDGRFWVIDGRKVYTIDDVVCEVSLDDRSLLKSCPVDKHTFIKSCEVCEASSPTVIPVKIHRDTKEVDVLMCAKCRETLGDLIDDYENSTIPVKNGSEDDAPW